MNSDEAQPAGAPAERLTVAVRILDREYDVRCAEDEVAILKASADDLDARMRAIRSASKVAGTDRVAIMAALNLAHENHRLRSNAQDFARRVEGVTERLTKALAERDSADGAPA